MRRSCLSVLILLPALLSGCGLVNDVLGPEAAQTGAPGPQADLLKRGDSVRVVVAGEQELSGVFTVGGDGKIHLELLGDVPAAGLTADMLAVNLRQRLSAGYLRNPQVTVARADEQMLRAGGEAQPAAGQKMPAAGQKMPAAGQKAPAQPVEAANLPPPPPLQGSLADGSNKTANPAAHKPAPRGSAPVLRQSQDVRQPY